MKRQKLVGKCFKIYQGDKYEGLAKVEKVENFNEFDKEAYCLVRFNDEPDEVYYRWVSLYEEVK